jgi:hypothetical protein
MSTRPTEEAKIVITTGSRRAARLTVVRRHAALIALIAAAGPRLR